MAGGAFALWEVTRRRAGAPTRAGLAAGWAALAFLLFGAVYEPLLMALDLSASDQCRTFWGPFLGRQVAWDLYWLLPSVALYLALRGAGRPRRRLAPRITVGLLVIAGLLPRSRRTPW